MRIVVSNVETLMTYPVGNRCCGETHINQKRNCAVPIGYNKDKPDKAHKYRVLRVCPYSFSIYSPCKNRNNEGCQKVRCTVKDKSNVYLSSRERTASRLGAFYQQETGQRPRVGVCRGNCPDRPVRVSYAPYAPD